MYLLPFAKEHAWLAPDEDGAMRAGADSCLLHGDIANNNCTMPRWRAILQCGIVACPLASHIAVTCLAA
eukprot:3935368-Pyramimonas_sp.AAC.1